MILFGCRRPTLNTLSALIVSLSLFATVADTPFEQETMTRIFWEEEGLPGAHTIAVDDQEAMWLLGENGLWQRSEDSLRRVDERFEIEIQPGMKMTLISGMNARLILADAQHIYRYPYGSKVQAISHDLGEIYDLHSDAGGDVYIACEEGLYRLERRKDEIQPIEEVEGAVRRLALGEEGELAAATQEKIYLQRGNRWRFEWIEAMFGEAVTALRFDQSGVLWIGTESCLHRWNPDLTFDRITGLEGLPYNNILTIEEGRPNEIWIGTTKGAIRHFEGEWDYYHGPRWTRGEAIHSIHADEQGQVWLAAEQGISQLRFREWTLEQKASYYEKMVRPRHDRYGLVADCHLSRFGDLSSYVLRDNDNDGLWTSIYLASLCFRYAVTEDPQVKELAWKHYEAMEFLEEVTGKEGYFARSYVKKGEPHEQGGEWHESEDGEWVWKSDTSSDELVGHMFVYPIFYDLVCETEEEKARVSGLVARIMDHIIENGFYLVDIDGEPTTWGVWAPEKLNHDPEWSIERGLNSLELLAALAAAHHCTGDEKYQEVMDQLINEHDYLVNLINQKITIPSEHNHSDDELAFLPYYTFLQCSEKYRDHPMFQRSLERAWEIERPEKSSLWNYIYAYSGAETYGAEEAVWTLQQWPLELIDWPCENMHRLDIRIHPEKSRFDRTQSVEVLPPDERPLMRWNGNPYRLDGGGGRREHDPGAWLLPYWMGRYHGFLE